MHVEFEYVKSLNQIADIPAKPLKRDTFHKLRMMIDVGKISSLRGNAET